MDDYERQNYELFNPEWFNCPHCEEKTHHEDWNADQECCIYCATPEPEEIEDDEEDVGPKHLFDFSHITADDCLEFGLFLILLWIMWQFFSVLGMFINAR